MRRIFAFLMIPLVIAGVWAIWPSTGAETDGAPNAPTVVYLVRHAEKVNDGARDPALSEAGEARAARLARMLRDESVAAVYCTATTRSRETGRPLAHAGGFDLSEYASMDGAGLSARIQTEHAGERVLVVAHSNTVPIILAALGGPQIPELNEADEYDRLFVVVLYPHGAPTTLSLRF